MTYFVGARGGHSPCKPEFAGERFEQGRVDEDVDALLREMDAHIVTPASEGHWAPGYYYVLFEDPDGIRLEVNHVPGQGVLAEDASFNPGNNW